MKERRSEMSQIRIDARILQTRRIACVELGGKVYHFQRWVMSLEAVWNSVSTAIEQYMIPQCFEDKSNLKNWDSRNKFSSTSVSYGSLKREWHDALKGLTSKVDHSAWSSDWEIHNKQQATQKMPPAVSLPRASFRNVWCKIIKGEYLHDLMPCRVRLVSGDTYSYELPCFMAPPSDTRPPFGH